MPAAKTEAINHGKPDEPIRRRFERIEKVCASFPIDSLTPRIEAVRAAMRDGGIVNVAVVGRFKAGKSSFLNDIIGRPVIPVGVLPVTTVVTLLDYAPMERASVRYLTGAQDEIPRDRLSEFVTEKSNPGNEKGVSLVELKLPALAHFQGLRFVDTPGLGSAFTHNTMTSMKWLPNIGAALVAVAVDSPLSDDDLQLIEELTRHTPEIAVLLTKADLVEDEQLSEVIDFIREQSRVRLNREFPVYPFSIRPDFAALREKVRGFLSGRLAGNRSEKFDEILSHKIRSLTEGCRDYLLLARQAAEAGQAARGELRELLQKERKEIDHVRNEMRLVLSDLKRRVENASWTHYKKFHSEMSERLRADLQEHLPAWTGNIADLSGAYSKWFAPTLDRELKIVFPRGGNFTAPFVAEAQSAYTRVVRAFQDRLAENIKKALNLTFSGAKFECIVHAPEKPDIRIGRTFDTPFELIHFLVPMRIFRKTIDRHLLRRLAWEAEKNLSRLSAQWSGAVNDSILQLARETFEFMRRELDTVEKLAAGEDNSMSDIQAALSEIENAAQ